MKINGFEIIGDTFAYDGCHKIYICESQSDEEEALSFGYKIIEIKYLKKVWESSCPLRFIKNWELTTQYVLQFEDAQFN